MVRAAEGIDVLVVNLAFPAPTTAATEVSEAEWRQVFAALVDPLPRLVPPAVPEMVKRRSGKVLVIGSASALRGMKRASSYSAARGAQLAYVQAVGVELAPHTVQVNAIAQNFVDNPTCIPAEVQANPRFQEPLTPRFHSAGSSRRPRLPSSRRIYAAPPPTASWAKSSRSAAVGFRGEGAA